MKQIVRCKFGSHLYGTSTPASDIDFKSVFIPDGMSHDLSWYYCWDCASGCIWDASAISLGACEKMPIKEAAA